MIGPMEFTEKLNKLLASKGLSQRDVVRLLGDVSKDTVNRWFTGKSIPDVKAARRLAEVLGVSLDFLADDRLDSPAEGQVTLEEWALLDLAREVGTEKLFTPWVDRQGMEDDDYERYVRDLAMRYTRKMADLLREELAGRRRAELARLGAEEFPAGPPAPAGAAVEGKVIRGRGGSQRRHKGA